MTHNAATQINEYLRKIESERFNTDYLDYSKQARKNIEEVRIKDILDSRRAEKKKS